MEFLKNNIKTIALTLVVLVGCIFGIDYINNSPILDETRDNLGIDKDTIPVVDTADLETIIEDDLDPRDTISTDTISD